MVTARTNTGPPDVAVARPGIEVLNRAVDILAAFAEGSRVSLSLAEISRRTGLPKATAHRLLAALDTVRLVERTETGNYQLGIRLFELGEHVQRTHELREAALPFMQDLYEATHDTVHLAVLEGTDVVYLERIRGHRQINVASRVGGRLPAACTGVGKALLAFNPEAAQQVLSATLSPRTPYSIVSPKVLDAEFSRIRETGVAFDREENAIGVHCAAAPILVAGRAVAAVSVTGSPARLDVDRIASAVRTAALGIQRTMATGPPRRGERS